MNKNFISIVPFFGLITLRPAHFKVFEIKGQKQILKTCNQRDFYKICLITGSNMIHYRNKEIKTEGTSLIFANANTTYNWEFISSEQKGYACILSSCSSRSLIA